MFYAWKIVFQQKIFFIVSPKPLLTLFVSKLFKVTNGSGNFSMTSPENEKNGRAAQMNNLACNSA